MIPMTFKELRKANNLSQAELATALGISASSVRQYEYGTRKPSDTVLTKIKELYGVDISTATSTPAGEKKKTTVPTLRRKTTSTKLSSKCSLMQRLPSMNYSQERLKSSSSPPWEGKSQRSRFSRRSALWKRSMSELIRMHFIGSGKVIAVP